jgi:hypothetical protein
MRLCHLVCGVCPCKESGKGLQRVVCERMYQRGIREILQRLREEDRRCDALSHGATGAARGTLPE